MTKLIKKLGKKKSRQVVKTGDVIAIPLPDGRYAFGLQMGENTAIYSVVANSPDNPPIGHRKFLFAVGVYKDVLSDMKWPKVGKDIVSQADIKFVSFGYIFHPDENIPYTLYSDFFDGYMRPSTKDECFGLEAVAGWDRHHIIERIISSLSGKISEWLWKDSWLPFGLDLSDQNDLKRVPLAEVIK